MSKSLNDMVEEIHRDLSTTSDTYRSYLCALYDVQAVEGSLVADNIAAASMIRKRAAEVDVTHPLITEKLTDISKALNVVLRRYGLSRKNRRDSFGGDQ